jgi:hypothetical protein
MSKKHFQAFADAIAQIKSQPERRRAADLVAKVCSESNVRFDIARFMQACNVKD